VEVAELYGLFYCVAEVNEWVVIQVLRWFW
jgi:hypothetical protein